MGDIKVLKDQEEQVPSRFVSFTAGNRRYEFVFMKASYFKSDTLVVDLLGNHNFLLNHETLDKKGHIEHVFHINQMEADQLRNCLHKFL
ncbi:SAV0927 family protein [Halobacillus campisalis]|uniref:SAV0927 family protein n=1 Tax=Halobacillus campisalis TaxID=435909 RepID=A0ABW2K5V0_9BACI|nr:SAV0927 family protein [Halobacillus campisalis]